MMTRRRVLAERQKARGPRRLAALLVLALALVPVLVIAHGDIHQTGQMSAACGLCLLGAQTARVCDPLTQPARPCLVHTRVAAIPSAPYTRLAFWMPVSRAPPILLARSNAS